MKGKTAHTHTHTQEIMERKKYVGQLLFRVLYVLLRKKRTTVQHVKNKNEARKHRYNYYTLNQKKQTHK